jgi:outer membrane protein assembly factor BamB
MGRHEGRRTTTIDLGQLRTGTDVSRPDAGRPARDRGGAVRRAGVALALVASLVSPAAQPPPPPGLVLVQTLPHSGGPPAVGGGSIYGLAPTASGMALTAYRLADGAQRWTVPVPASEQTPWVEVSGDVPIVTGLDPTRPGQLDLEMAAFDPDTGRLLWSRVGSPHGPGPAGSGVVAVQRQLSNGGVGPGPAATEFAAVDIRTGRVRWTFRTADGVATVLDPDVPAGGGQPAMYAVTVAPGGVLTRHDPATGEELARVRTGAEPQDTYLRLAGELVFVWHGPNTRRRLAVHDAATLAHRWTEVDVDVGGVVECGQVVCLWHNGSRPRIHGLDPVTGRVRWSAPCGGPGDGLCDIDVGPLGPGRLAVQDEPFSPARRLPPARVLDAATGEPVGNLHGWFPLWPSNGPGVVVRRVLREPVPPDTDGRISFGRLRPGTASVRTLGTIDAGWCQPHGEHLVCSTGDAAWQVWRIR